MEIETNSEDAPYTACIQGVYNDHLQVHVPASRNTSPWKAGVFVSGSPAIHAPAPCKTRFPRNVDNVNQQAALTDQKKRVVSPLSHVREKSTHTSPQVGAHAF